MMAHQKVDEIVAFVEAARSLPMSSSVVLNRSDLLTMLSALRDALPGDLKEAQDVLERREQLLSESAATAERLLTAAHEEKLRLISDAEVVRAARIEAGELIATARDESQQMSRQVDGYVDAKLAHLEVSVSNILDAIRRGRIQLADASGAYGELGVDDASVDDFGRDGPDGELRSDDRALSE